MVRIPFLEAAILSGGILVLAGCDRLRRATVEDQDRYLVESPCGKLGVKADHFVDMHFFLEVGNMSAGPLDFRVRNLDARDGDHKLEYRVQLKGKETEADTLRLAAGETLVFDILTGKRSITVSAASFFGSGPAYCDLDTLYLKVVDP
jgi:hypothetical protein